MALIFFMVVLHVMAVDVILQKLALHQYYATMAMVLM